LGFVLTKTQTPRPHFDEDLVRNSMYEVSWQ